MKNLKSLQYIFTFRPHLNNTAEKEIKRTENLYKQKILDAPSDEYFDEITLLATKIFNLPIQLLL